MPNKAICIVSGGIDSTTMLYKLIDEGYKPIVLTFLYGQKHSLEAAYAEHHAKRNGLEYHLLTIPKLPSIALTDKDVEATVVPNRNMVFLSIAASYAIAHKCEKVFYAAHKGDAIYRDSTRQFMWGMNLALVCGNHKKVYVEAPFIDLTKAEVVALGDELGVPFNDTWSCYDPVMISSKEWNDKAIHCGVCDSCRERKEAFKTANVEDPTRYAK